MHQYESRWSGYKSPYVWAPGKRKWDDKPATYEHRISRYPTNPAGLNTCGPDTKPAEDVPEDDVVTAVTASMELDSPTGLDRSGLPATFRGRPLNGDPNGPYGMGGGIVFVVPGIRSAPDDVPPPAATAKTAAPAAETAPTAAPPATGEAQTNQLKADIEVALA